MVGFGMVDNVIFRDFGKLSSAERLDRLTVDLMAKAYELEQSGIVSESEIEEALFCALIAYLKRDVSEEDNWKSETKQSIEGRIKSYLDSI